MNTFGEGGFMQDAGGAGGEGKRGSKNPQQGLLPVTCKQVLTAEAVGDAYRIDGQETTQITLVGQQCYTVQQANYIAVTIDDGTGLVQVRHWVDSATEAAAQVKELCSGNNYIRVFGNLRSFQGNKDVLAQRIQAVNTFDEVTYHLLQCMTAHLAHTRGLLAPPSASHHGAAAASGTGAADDGMMYPSNVHHMVHEIVRACRSEMGENVRNIYAQLAGVASEERIDEAIQFLVAQGIFWTGVDQNHYKCQ